MNIAAKYASLTAAGVVAIFASSSSTNFRLDAYGIGSGGSSDSSSSSYKSNTISGEASAAPGSGSTSYQLQSGLTSTQNANVPAAPTVTNPASYYNKLHIVLDTGGNPTDAKFAIAISTDSFATTQYIQNDTTIGANLGPEDYQTFAAWGGAGGFDVIGLASNTTYSVKVKAARGTYGESAFGPVATGATVGISLTFDIDVSASDTETGAPYATNFGSLLAGTVIDSPERIWIDFDTNGASGGNVFIGSANTGLKSVLTTYTISAATGNLAALNEGFGAQNVTATQSSGGPLTPQSPYTGSADNVGVTDTSLRQFYVSGGPIISGRGSLILKAKAKSDTPAAGDYSDTLTLIAAASF